MAVPNFDVFATRLRDERLDAKLKQTIAHELCETLESFQPQEYTRFVAILWPVIRDLLLKTPPVFVSSAPEQKLRSTLLEVIQRIPHSEVFRPVVLDVVTTLVALVKIENEENAVVCLKIIYELHRMYRQLLESISLPFLELAVEIYRNADQMLKAMDSLDTPAALSTPNISLTSPSAMSPGPDVSDSATKNLTKATASFKVLTEIPIIVVSIIQANRRHADPFVSNILPLILHMLELNPKSTAFNPESAQHQHQHLYQHQHWRAAHSDLITAQSKTLSFLAFFARGFTTLLIPCQDRIAHLTLQLLCLCPAEATATRKEMLIATRHIVSTEIRKAFVPIADKFLDMQVLVGSGLASQCILKPFAFSMLADLMHHIRLELSPSQLTRMVDFYTGCMHDQSLSSGVHTMCAKLLHNITERIMLLDDKQHGRILLLSILKTFISSFSAIGNQAAAAISDIRSGGVYSEEKIYGSAELIRTNAFEQGDKTKELRLLLRSLVTGSKNVIYGLKRCDSMLAQGMEPRAANAKVEGMDTDNSGTGAGAGSAADGNTNPATGANTAKPGPGSANSLVAAVMHEAQLVGFELDLLSSLFREGLRACRIHDIDRVRSEVAAAKQAANSGSAGDGSTASGEGQTDASGFSGPGSASPMSREMQIKMIDRESKEQIEQLANLFIALDPAVFHELFTSQFEFAFQTMVGHCAAISCVQVFVASDPNSPAFISIMLRYLCDRLELLGSEDEALTSTMLHLFKIAFFALALYPESNEPVLQPYVQVIINSALTISRTAKRPKNYFLLLRALFRSIGGGRYESLYKEVFPVLQNLLETLNSALGFVKTESSMQDLFVEICLTVPVRLSVLLPYLSLLMKPLVFALESGPEQVSQGLRTLELCIDNLTREFLDPILTPVMDEIMSSLWLHLRLSSSTSTHAPVAARILGKLGGRNRHMLLTRFPALTSPASAAAGSDAVDGANNAKLIAPMTFESLSGLVSMPLMEAVFFSVKVLEGRISAKQLAVASKDAVEFVMACARYTLVMPCVSDEDSAADAKASSSRLIALTSDPLALKRLANISSPSSQGGQILERIISSCPSIGSTFKVGATTLSSEVAMAAGNKTLDGLCADPNLAGNSLPIDRSGLLYAIWALSLASTHSNDAWDLLHKIIILGARQHVIQSAEAVSLDSSTRPEDGSRATFLSAVVPEAISRVLVSNSLRMRTVGTKMLRAFHLALCELLPERVALVGQLPAMRNIVSDLCAACYAPEVETKQSGRACIAFIVEELDMGRAWLAENLLELSKALMFTLKDAHSNVLPGANPAESSATLLRIIKQAFPRDIFAPTVDDEDADVEMDTEVGAEDSSESNADVLMPGSDLERNHRGDGSGDGPGSASGDTFAAKPEALSDNSEVKTAESTKDNRQESDAGKDDDGDKAMVVDSASANDKTQPAGSAAEAKIGENGSGNADHAQGSADADTSAQPVVATSGDASTSATINANKSDKASTSNNKPVDGSGPEAAAAAASTETTKDGSKSAHGAAGDEGKPKPKLDHEAVNTPTSPTSGLPTVTSPASVDSAEASALEKAKQEEMVAATQRAHLAFKRLSARLSPENSRLLKAFLALITKELANPSTEVRDAAKACLEILVEVTGCGVTALLLPSRDRLLVPIFSKPLRALPHNMQIGNIDAITYCLTLDPPLLEISEELLRLLSEALALADAEDQALVNHPAQVRSNTVSLTHLRHVCIRMLTAAMVRPEFADAKNAPTRARIISVFFKSLYHKSVEVVDAANDGLKQVLLQQQKLPRDLLQTGLRPILLNLSDYKRLTVASLDGLARLLQLLTNYFKVEVGRKLLDHMQQWANPQLLQAASEKSIEDVHEIKILVAILQVFHLLPSSAGVLLNDLVESVIGLETHLCRRESSPFRKPLFKFLNSYPSESVTYFIERLASTHHMRIFVHALRSAGGEPLHDALVAQTPSLIAVLNDFYTVPEAGSSEGIENGNGNSSGSNGGNSRGANGNEGDSGDGSNAMVVDSEDAAVNGSNEQKTAAASQQPSPPSKRLYMSMEAVVAIRACLEYRPKWLDERNDLLQALLRAWSRAIALETIPNQPERLARLSLIENLVHCLLLATRAMNNPPGILFRLLEVTGRSSDAIDVSFVFQYVWQELVVKWPISKRREILSAFLMRLADDNASDESNAILLQHLINPMVATVFTLPRIAISDSANTGEAGGASRELTHEQRGVELLRGPVIVLISQRVWAVHMPSAMQASSAKRASVRLELVQLSSILIRHAANAVADLRKDIIKFGWTYIRNDDIMIKNASYVLVAQFIAAFDTPPKIILQAYSSLLKAHQVESRFLVRQALDILLLVLPIRLMPPAAPSGAPGSAGEVASPAIPAWIGLAKRILIENSASLVHTTHVYQLIASHAEIFFPYRNQFAANLVGILQKMCLTHSATSETRTLALDIMDLFLKWHGMLEGTGKSAGGGGGAAAGVTTAASSDPALGGKEQSTDEKSGASSPSSAAGGGSSAPSAHDNASTEDSKANGSANGSGSGSGAAGVGQVVVDQLMPESRRETIVGLLLRMLCLVFDFALKSTLGPRALELLTQYLDTNKWPPMHLRLTFFERSMQQIEAQGMNQQLVQHILTVLSAVTAQMQPIWFEEYYGVLVGIVRKCMAVDNGQVQKIVAGLLKQLYEQAAQNERLGALPAAADLRAHVESAISKNLQDNTNIYGTLLVLHAIGEHTGEQFYLYVPPLMKLVQRYTKDHNSHAASSAAASASQASNGSQATTASGPPALHSFASGSIGTAAGLHSADTNGNGGSRMVTTSSEIIRLVSSGQGQVPLSADKLIKGETPMDILLMLLLLMRDHITQLGDQRRNFLTHIIQLIERSSDAALLHVILALVRDWVMDPQDVFPTIKEKAMLMSSMMSFVHGSMSASDNASRASVRAGADASADAGHGDPFSLLERKYLTLVLEVYNDARFTRSEMTMRLEQAFLSGMQSEDSEMRGRFLATFDANMPAALPVRLNYLLETQNWESVSSTFWLQQCLPLLFASAHQQASLSAFAVVGSNRSSRAKSTAASAAAFGTVRDDAMDVDAEGDAADASPASAVTVGDIVRPLSRLVLLDTQFAYNTWLSLFPLLWQGLGTKEQHDLTSGIIRLLAKPYHQAQTGARPNVIQAILESFCACQPSPRLPPQLLRYLGQSYCAWYPALSLLETKLLERREIESAIFDRAAGVELGAFDALTELYTSLSSQHYFYGAWKRHCQYRESHVALAYEQLEDWAGAQAAYERAQTKARAGVLPFSESEYCLWESRWVEVTKRLQSWDMLLDLGLHESLPEIELDAGWRVWDWTERSTQVRQLLKAAPTEFGSSPRARFYETFLVLSRGSGSGPGSGSKAPDFQRMCKEGIRACLQQWNELPAVGTPAHISLLHMFQLMVELGDASNIYTSLAATKADNLEAKSGDLKSVLQTWRERLPNNSDPINIWSDLVAWRQHVFKAINDVYVPFIAQQQQQQQQKSSGVEEIDGDTASATPKTGQKTKGARKNADSDADSANKDDSAGAAAKGATGSSNNSVLTSYAYRGYHEMAWIINRFAHVARLHNLVDVCISSLTRIYTLPNIEIQEAFLKLREQAKCYYHRPQELQSGLDVISNTNLVYFSLVQKAEFFTLKGQFLAKLGKLEEANHAFATGIQCDLASPKAWAAWGRYNDERFCSNIPDTTGAVNAISCYMQAAGLSKRPRVRRYLARTLWLLCQDDAAGNVCAAFDAYKSEMPTWYWIAFVPQLLSGLDAPYSRQAQQILLRIAKQYPQALYYALRTAREEALVARRRQAAESPAMAAAAAASGTAGATAAQPSASASATAPSLAVDELMPKLKTAHPLLALSMETMIDQIVHRLKPCPEEDIYRLVHALLTDGLQQLHSTVSQPRGDYGLVDTIVANTCRVAMSLPAGAIKTRFEQDFGGVRGMDLCEYVTKLYQWQQMLRRAIRRRPRKVMLSLFSPFLVEFEQQKFEDVEVPGQYLRLTDTSDDFVRIGRFIPDLSIVLRSGIVARTLAVRGSDGSILHFAVQHMGSRHNHQEERWVQLYRNVDMAAEHDRDTWEQRRLAFHLPTIVSLAPHISLVQERADSFTLQDVYDASCVRHGTTEIAPVLHYVARMRALAPGPEESQAAAAALYEHICQHMVPSSLLADDVRLHTASSMDYWLYRENFSFQIAVTIALTYIIASSQRTPSKMSISRSTGNICLSELVPTQATPGLIHSKEPVPFRLTPAIQTFVTELGLEGILPFGVHKVAHRLTEREHLLRDFLDLFVRDELIHMPTVRTLAATNPAVLSEMCDRNVKLIIHRASQLAETLPAKDVQDKELSPMQPLIQLMTQAVSPANLAQMDFVWMPWL
ncbi:transcription-associated protein 1 [Coemansia sp. Benny D115]|nr:transcription-associated protein 1 [Coemansia sp. Benny D115]